MHREQIRLMQVYRINGRLVVANSIEGAINTWREWMSPNCPDINNIERMGNDALLFVEGLCDDLSNQFVENIARLTEEKERLMSALQKREAYIKNKGL